MQIVTDAEGKRVGIVEAPAPRAPTETEAKIAAAKERLAAATKAKAAAGEDPAVQAAELQLELARVERAAALAEHELATDAVYRAACLERGGDLVARIRTREGSVVIRCETEAETDERHKLVGALARVADGATGSDRTKALFDMELQARACLTKLLLSSRPHLDRVTAKYPALWGAIERARADLASGLVLAEGKDGGA